MPKSPINTVLIPCFRRPEFLAACLKYITLAEGWDRQHYLFSVDTKKHATGKHDPEVLAVIEQFPGKKTLRMRPNAYNGNTYNLLEGYREALEIARRIGSELIYMIETDIFVARDFFTWHEGVQAEHDYFFASACRNQNNKAAQSLPNEPESNYLWPRYQSLGNSFKLAEVEKFIVHAKPPYYNDMWGYLRKAFAGKGEAIFKNMWCEQDGMINRLMVQNDLLGIFPFVPRAYHAGFHGYNRKGDPLPKSMSLAERTVAIMTMTEEEMNKRAGNPQFKDITMCDLLGRDCEKYNLVNVPITV